MAETLHGKANAKVNLGLMVRSRGADGFHSIFSVVQSISWSDELWLAASDDDDFRVEGMTPQEDNLAWLAVKAVREAVESSQPIALRLEKQVPIAAGLGGGSADAAAGLGMAARFFGFPQESLSDLAGELGADVPFCLTGGLAQIEGRGEQVTPQDPLAEDYALAIVVPPVELPTADVYAEWDRLNEPSGPVVPESALPPSLRRFQPLRNDLAPAAHSLAPLVSEWQDELMSLWDRPVMMTGSGPSLYGFFLDVDEAGAALESLPAGSRAYRVAGPVARGWEMSSGTLAGPN
ncbi:MAG: hypothetical protein V3S60_12020 [Acidimicrobiia bacterium]